MDEFLESFWQWYARSQQQAISQGVPPQELDWLIVRVAGIDKLALRLKQVNLGQEQIKELDRLWQQRLYQRIPVQYLSGSVTWRHLELQVSPSVLIPRPETELIIDLVKLHLASSAALPGVWVDLGTGSGAIALGLAEVLPASVIHAVDCSVEALAIARANITTYRRSQQILLHQGSWFEPLTDLKGQIAGMVANPPYIPTIELASLQEEVLRHEPILALDGGMDGLDAVRHLIDVAPLYLIPGGLWLVELMAGQAETVRLLLKTSGNYTQIQIHWDDAGIERFVSALSIG